MPYTSSLITDTGCSGHYFMTDYVMPSAPVHDMQPASPGIAVTLPDGNKIISSHTDNLNIPGLPSASSQCHIFPELAYVSFLYIGLLCYHDWDAHFHFFLITSLNGVKILTGPRSSHGLWTIPHPQYPTPNTLHANLVISTATKTVSDRISFYHDTMFSPTIYVWCRSINAGHITTWTHLISKQVGKCLL